MPNTMLTRRIWLVWLGVIAFVSTTERRLLSAIHQLLEEKDSTAGHQSIRNLLLVDDGFLSTDESFPDGICKSLCTISNGRPIGCKRSLSTTVLWHRLRHQILQASYFPLAYANRAEFREWVDNLFAYYTADRMRKSVAFPANLVSTAEIVRILDESVSSGNATRPLRIMVMGGSVTLGAECHKNPVNITGIKKEECAWAARWEHLINQALFGGQKIVDVSNSATAMTTSDIGAMVLEYQLYLSEDRPDVVVNSFAPNDIQHKITDEEKLKNLERFTTAAHSLHCQESKPLVIMVDDFYGLPQRVYSLKDVMRHTGHIHQATAWHQSMGVSYANLVRNTVYSYPQAKTNGIIPLVSSNYEVHMGMAFHIGMAWTMLYNMLNSLVDHCNEEAFAFSAAPDIFSADELPVKTIPHVADHPKINPLQDEWRERTKEENLRCANEQESNATAVKPCSYSWVGLPVPRQIKQVLDPVLQAVSGWKQEGFKNQQPRAGWYAKEERAVFSIRIVADQTPIKFLNLLYMKTYDQGDSLLQVTTRVIHHDGTEAEGSFELTNRHEKRTSVHYLEKFELPTGGAVVGETVETTFALVQGDKFKIAGMAYCAR